MSKDKCEDKQTEGKVGMHYAEGRWACTMQRAGVLRTGSGGSSGVKLEAAAGSGAAVESGTTATAATATMVAGSTGQMKRQLQQHHPVHPPLPNLLFYLFIYFFFKYLVRMSEYDSRAAVTVLWYLLPPVHYTQWQY